MKYRWFFAFALSTLFGSTFVWSQDTRPQPARLPRNMRDVENPSFAKIDRKIGKEPVYKKEPKYCLVVLGAEAKTRIWVVVDGGTLYADLNGNGDLTEKTEQFKEGNDPNGHTWQIGDITEGKKEFKHVNFAVDKFNDYAFRIGVEAAYEGVPNLYGYAQLKFGTRRGQTRQTLR